MSDSIDSSDLWMRFLKIRLLLIHAWVAEGMTYKQIANTLSMDSMQVQLISMTSPNEMP